jgi:hypothetical protein
MAKWRERECVECHQVITTASKSNVCLTCKCKMKSKDAVQKELDIIEDYGYGVNGEPTKNNFGKRVYQLIAPCCGGEFSSVFGNLMSGIKKNEQSGYNKLPCGICGPKHRMATALAGYEAKHGKDYDIEKFNHYQQLVRKLSNQNYKKHKAQINPENHVRGLNHSYHLDHITPIIECFKQGWTAEQAADVSNLQMLEWSENLTKGAYQ